jgi:aspartyl-tRNA(Asn)/glutamyl-tRNA(Gln) amidotransferase subunit A
MSSIEELGRDLAEGRVTSRALVEDCLERIADPAGEGARAFLHVDADGARAAADAQDALRAHGVTVSPLAGIPLSVKDLFDVSGQVTRAGSLVLDEGPAEADEPAVARLRAAGMVIVGRTNMTEFAFSGLGLNPHHGTPSSPWDRATGRIPGGSSAGAAVSVADGMAAAAIGSDTGGSCRIPAHCCGIVGYKPSAWRVPLDGAYPLSFSLDSIGPFGRTVSCCALVDAALAGDDIAVPDAIGPRGLRLAVPRTLVLDGLDDTVAAAFSRTLDTLSAAGAVIEDVDCAEWGELPSINAKGGIPAAEAYALHAARLAADGDRYDQRVRRRITGGSRQTAADYIDTLKARDRLIDLFEDRAAAFDAFVMPTVAVVAPAIAPLVADDALYDTANRLALRNTSVGNFLDGCSISVPCHEDGAAPVGFMLLAPNGHDRHLMAVASGVEAALAAGRR